MQCEHYPIEGLTEQNIIPGRVLSYPVMRTVDLDLDPDQISKNGYIKLKGLVGY